MEVTITQEPRSIKSSKACTNSSWALSFSDLPIYHAADILENQKFGLAVFCAELLEGLSFDGLGQFAGEIHGRNAFHAAAIAGLPFGSQSQGQMRFSRAAGAVQNDRIVTVGRFLEHGADDYLDQAIFRSGQEVAGRIAWPGAFFWVPGEPSISPGRGMSIMASTMTGPSSINRRKTRDNSLQKQSDYFT